MNIRGIKRGVAGRNFGNLTLCLCFGLCSGTLFSMKALLQTSLHWRACPAPLFERNEVPGPPEKRFFINNTHFFVDSFQQSGFKSANFGVADVLACEKWTTVEGVTISGVLEAGASRQAGARSITRTDTGVMGTGTTGNGGGSAQTKKIYRRFHGAVELKPVSAALDFSKSPRKSSSTSPATLAPTSRSTWRSPLNRRRASTIQSAERYKRTATP